MSNARRWSVAKITYVVKRVLQLCKAVHDDLCAILEIGDLEQNYESVLVDN